MVSFSRPCLERNTQNPSSPEIVNFLTTRTGDQMVQLIRTMQGPKAQAALTTALLFAPPAVSGSAAVPEKAKKALNAFVGFRCYYINIPPFKEWPMKKLSQPMGTLWESDPNKSKWSLMTKAWSTIRDQIGKDNAPLDEFYSFACPYLNIPPPDVYLQQLGWVLGLDQHGAPKVTRQPSFTTESASVGVAEQAHSVDDIIRYCQSMGYAQDFILNPNPTFATFLGHSNIAKPNTGNMKQTVTSVQAEERRAAERERRRVRRQLAQQTGITAHFHGPIENVQHPTQIGSPVNNGDDYQAAQEFVNQNVTDDPFDNLGSAHYDTRQSVHHQASADEAFYNNVRGILSDLPSEHSDATVQDPNNVEFDPDSLRFGFSSTDFGSHEEAEIIANLAAFKEGADANATLPDMDFSV